MTWPDPNSGSPPPPTGQPLDSPPPPPTGLPTGANHVPPPLGSPGLPYRGQVGFAQTQRTAEELGEETRKSRLARRRLAASPELMAVSVGFLLIFGLAVGFEPVALLFGSLAYGIFGWMFLVNGDAIVASLILCALGVTTMAYLANLAIDDDSLTWTLPALFIIGAESAITYNHFRRRESDISSRIGQTILGNLIAVVVLTVVLASVVRWLTQVDGRVEWPWYATTIMVLSAAWFAGLIVLRRTATPAERRRYNPGQRMLPPPR